MPSARTSRLGPAYPESSLRDLGPSPRSERAAERRAMATGSASQFEDGLADPQGRADLDRAGAVQPVPPDEGAVGGAEVLDDPAVPPGRVGIDPAMASGGVVVVEDERALGVAADEHAAAAQREGRAGERALGHHERGGGALGAAAALASRGPFGGS